MRGNLGEIDIRSILRLLESERQTGILYVESEMVSKVFRRVTAESAWISSKSNLGIVDDDKDNYSLTSIPRQKSWFIFLINGRIAYASDNQDSELLRIQDYLSYYQLDNSSDMDKISVNIANAPEYNYLIYLLQQQLITPQQTKSIIHKIIYETLFELLSLSRGTFIFKSDSALSPSITEITIFSSIKTVNSQLKVWKQLYPYVRSPEDYPILQNQYLTDKIANSKAYITLSNWVAKQLNLRRLSRQLNCYLVDLAKVLYPYIQKGLVTLQKKYSPNSHPLLTSNLKSKPHIVYVDNDVAIGKKVEYILKQRGYNLTIFTDSIQALTEILQIKPDLVFCKIDLPQLSGNELCIMLQNSWVCRQTKVIMLSEPDNFFDRIKATIISSDDYLSLPFTSNELLVSIEKHLGKHQINNLSLGVEWSTEKSNN